MVWLASLDKWSGHTVTWYELWLKKFIWWFKWYKLQWSNPFYLFHLQTFFTASNLFIFPLNVFIKIENFIPNNSWYLYFLWILTKFSFVFHDWYLKFTKKNWFCFFFCQKINLKANFFAYIIYVIKHNWTFFSHIFKIYLKK